MPPGRLHYFAYGSNMSAHRLRTRVAGAEAMATAHLPGHRLAFHKRGRDGSAKCDIVPCPDASVHGVVFAISARERPLLDRCEDLGRGYTCKEVEVVLGDGGTLRAFTYVALLIASDLRPFAWYRQHVLAGAREAGLPADYVAAIAAVSAIDDPDPRRHAREMALYTAS